MSDLSIADPPAKIYVAVNRAHVNKDMGNEWDFNNSFTNEHLTRDQLVMAIKAGRAFTSPHEHINRPKEDGKKTAFRHSDNWISSQHDGADFDYSSFDGALQVSFVRDYTNFLYTTSSHTPENPRSRAVFIFDQVVTDKAYYAKIKKAIVWHLGRVIDRSCKDVARVFYGSKDCEVLLLNNVLPLAVVDQLIAEYEAEEARIAAAAQAERAQKAAARAASGRTDNDDVIGEYNRTHPLTDLLIAHGYHLIHEGATVDKLSRPDKPSSKGVIVWKDSAEGDTCYIHSSNDRLFNDAGHAQDAFDVFCKLNHGGDFGRAFEAAKREQGKWIEKGAGSSSEPYPDAYTGTADTLEETPTEDGSDAEGDGEEKPKFRVSLKVFADLVKWGYGGLWLSEMDESLMIDDRRFTDADRAQLRMTARDNQYGKFKLMGTLDDALLAYAAKRKRHPVREYLGSLEWDGQDHIKALASYFTDTHPPIAWSDGKPRSLFYVALFRWLVCAVAKQMGDKDASRYNFVLVLSSKQGSGKSHFTNWICPLPEYFVERQIITGDKDCSLQRARAMVWEISELGATTRRADVEALKAHITQATVSERAAYGRFDTVRPAVASYIGTVNPDGAGFLTDSTGNRRFAVLDIASIDWSYATNIDINQVWAQAMNVWHLNPKAYRMRPEESAAFDTNANEHLEPDVFADAIAQVFDIDPAQTSDEEWRINSMLLLEKLRILGGISRGHDKAQAREVARALKAHWGIVGFRSNGATFYRGLKVKE